MISKSAPSALLLILLSAAPTAGALARAVKAQAARSEPALDCRKTVAPVDGGFVITCDGEASATSRIIAPVPLGRSIQLDRALLAHAGQEVGR